MLTLAGVGLVDAAQPASAPSAAPRAAVAAQPDLAWRALSSPQRRALQPLEREWGGLDPVRRQKWLEIADRFPALSPEDQARAQARMTQWAQLSPEDRGKARLLFQQAKQVSPGDRATRWEAYQALTENERKELAERAASTAKPASKASSTTQGTARDPREVATRKGSEVGAKSNLVPNPALAAPPTPVAPTVIQAGPGATTSLVSRRPEPPLHQQPGLPKITATPGFVDPTTLQPKRGAQAAATRSAVASAPVPRP